MIKNIFVLGLLVLSGFLLFGHPVQAEAKHHCRSSSVGLNVNVGTRCNDTYVSRRYVSRPVVVPTTVVVPQGYYTPYYAPVYTYQVAPVVPTFYEEVYVAPAPRCVGFSGLSFSWNFFK